MPTAIGHALLPRTHDRSRRPHAARPRAARESLSHVLGVRSDAVHGGSRRLRSRCIGYFIPIVLN